MSVEKKGTPAVVNKKGNTTTYKCGKKNSGENEPKKTVKKEGADNA